MHKKAKAALALSDERRAEWEDSRSRRSGKCRRKARRWRKSRGRGRGRRPDRRREPQTTSGKAPFAAGTYGAGADTCGAGGRAGLKAAADCVRGGYTKVAGAFQWLILACVPASGHCAPAVPSPATAVASAFSSAVTSAASVASAASSTFSSGVASAASSAFSPAVASKASSLVSCSPLLVPAFVLILLAIACGTSGKSGKGARGLAAVCLLPGVVAVVTAPAPHPRVCARLYSYMPWKYNFGDAAGPVIAQAMAGVQQFGDDDRCNQTTAIVVLALGSVARRGLSEECDVTLWGTGARSRISKPRVATNNSAAAAAAAAAWAASSPCHRLGVPPSEQRLDVRAVRGPLTFVYLREAYPDAQYKLVRNKLPGGGYETQMSYGDPALLLPAVFPACRRACAPRHPLCLVPHHADEGRYFGELGTQPGAGREWSVRNVTTPFTQMLEWVLECDLVVSSSLHGLIFAEAFGVPARWLEGREHPTKYCDYYAATRAAPSRGLELGKACLRAAASDGRGKGNSNSNGTLLPFARAPSLAAARQMGGAPAIYRAFGMVRRDGYSPCGLLRAFPTDLTSHCNHRLRPPLWTRLQHPETCGHYFREATACHTMAGSQQGCTTVNTTAASAQRLPPPPPPPLPLPPLPPPLPSAAVSFTASTSTCRSKPPTCVAIPRVNSLGRIGLGNAIIRTVERLAAASLTSGLSACQGPIDLAARAMCWIYDDAVYRGKKTEGREPPPWDLARHFNWPLLACPIRAPDGSSLRHECVRLPSHMFMPQVNRSWEMALNRSTVTRRLHFDPSRRFFEMFDDTAQLTSRTCASRRWFGGVSPEIAAIAAPVIDRMSVGDRLLAVHHRAGDSVVAPRFNARDHRPQLTPAAAAAAVRQAAELFRPAADAGRQLRVFISTDDATFIANLKTRLASPSGREPSVELLHLVHGFRTIESQSTDADMHAIADWHLLTRSDALLMLGISTFSKSAAHFGMARCSVMRTNCTRRKDWYSHNYEPQNAPL